MVVSRGRRPQRQGRVIHREYGTFPEGLYRPAPKDQTLLEQLGIPAMAPQEMQMEKPPTVKRKR